MWKFNKGEWSEAYVFLKLLADKEISHMAPSSEETTTTNSKMEIKKIFRHDANHNFIFELDCDYIIQYEEEDGNKKLIQKINYDTARQESEFLLEKIKKISAHTGAIARSQAYLESLGLSSPKIPRLPEKLSLKYGSKTDIIIYGLNPVDQSTIDSGYSIKSYIGSPPTLFNSSQTSGFVFLLENCNDDIMHNINSIKSEKELIQNVFTNKQIKEQPIGVRNDEFIENLNFIELRMTDVLVPLILIALSEREKSVEVLTQKLIEENPLKLKYPSEWYPAKIKDFLYASFSGMTASTHWDGRRRMTGGYIKVFDSGELKYYKALSDDDFSNYLYQSTKIEFPSRGVSKDIAHLEAVSYLNNEPLTEEDYYNATHSTTSKGSKKKDKKGDWGYIYKKNGNYYIALNFQIRFK